MINLSNGFMRSSLIRYSILAIFTALMLFNSCKKDNAELPPDEPLAFLIPEGWPAPFYNFEDNPVSKAGFELGRKIFYDVRLSRDNTVSCGTCHQQFSAFAQLDHNVSHGVDDLVGTRNSPPLFNLNWHTAFFWDGGVNHIEVQPINPITNPVEMDETLVNVVNKLSGDEEYKKMFRDAFGDETVNTQRIMKSLAQFMGLMISSNARYDRYKRGEESLSAQELSGLAIFQAQCASCHTEPLFTDFSFRSNGLPLIPGTDGLIDSGRAKIPPYAEENLYKFKIPSLRNLKYTAPYMHDGRFTTLEAVLDHYAAIDPASFNLDPLLEEGISLTESERADLLAFLNTLNDESFVKDKRFAEVR